MKKIGKIKILDAEYSVYLYKDGEFKDLNDNAKDRNKRYLHPENELSGPIDGYCDYMSKEIHVYADPYTDPSYFGNTIRHEITHAFLYEIGNSNCDDEDYVDKISKWTPQIEKYFNNTKQLIELEEIKCSNT